MFPDRKQFKINYSDNLVDIVGLLLKKDRRERLGAKDGIKEILAHPWFSDLNVQEILAQTMKPPLKPDFKDQTKYFEADANPEAL